MRFYTHPPSSDVDVLQAHWQLMYEKDKYKIMWALRHLEDQIEKENGIFLLWDNNGVPSLQFKEFSNELKVQISEALSGCLL